MFRFAIRDLVWLTALVAMCTGWWTEQRRVEKVSVSAGAREAAAGVREMKLLALIDKKNEQMLSDASRIQYLSKLVVELEAQIPLERRAVYPCCRPY